jgi:hypothetical protein
VGLEFEEPEQEFPVIMREKKNTPVKQLFSDEKPEQKNCHSAPTYLRPVYQNVEYNLG